MNIIYLLLQKFFLEESWNAGLMIVTSFILNILQTNGISYITANIIDSIQKADSKTVGLFFKYFIAISIFYIIIYHWYKYFQTKLLTKLRQWMRHQLIRLLLLVNNEDFSEMNFTKLSSPINRVSSVCFMVFTDLINYILPNITFLFIISAYFLYQNTVFGSVFITGNLGLIGYLWLNWSTILEHNDAYETHVNETEAYLVDILNNIDKIIYRGQTDQEIAVFSDKTDNCVNSAFTFYSNTNYHGTIMNCIVFANIFILVGLLIRLYFDKKIGLTIFITFFTIILLYRDKMMTMIQQIPDFIEFLGRSESVLKHFKNIENVVYNQEYPPITLDFYNINFENVSFTYKTSEMPVFQDKTINLDLRDKIIGITGLSGKGKSSFAKLILKMYKCSKGAIYIDDQDIANIDANYIRKNITYVNQNTKLFDKIIADNMMYGCNDTKICEEHLTEIMRFPKIGELYKNHNIHTKQSGSLGENLSGGQRQVVNIIGGLINPSKILILDEPTNALDQDLKQEILGLIVRFRRYKQCIIIITHDRDVFSLFDETVEI